GSRVAFPLGNMADSADSEGSESSEVLSDFAEERFKENGTEQQYGVEPYQFEPIGPANNVEVEENEPQTAMEIERADRLGNTHWCTCGNCVVMETIQESVCCRATPAIQNEILVLDLGRENPPLCITDHPGFQPVCLNMWVLQNFAFRQRYGRAANQDSDEERYRYTAYRQLVRFCWGYLGREIRVTLPSCAVIKIINQFPSANQNYTGFRYAPLD
ncbi:hypothetical protein QZH41_020569, partial [Actinostola sp. cb2023]